MPRDSEDSRPPTVKGEENIDPASTSDDPPTSTSTNSASPPLPLNRTSIFRRPPLHLSTLSLIERFLHLSSLTPNIFTNTFPLYHPPGARGLYGGLIIGQSIVAASSTVAPSLHLHSIHSYFVLAGDASLPITYSVHHVRTGRSFATRQVSALQRGEVIFLLIASFQKPVPSTRRANGSVAEWQTPMPDVPPPHLVLSEEQKIKSGEEIITKLSTLISTKRTKNPNDPSIPSDDEKLSYVTAAVARRKARLARDPFEWRKVSPSTYPPEQPYSERKVLFWVRARDKLLPESQSGIPHVQMAALAYFTDNWFIGTVGRVNPAAGGRNLSMMVSLDHAVYFHGGKDIRVDARGEGQAGDGWLLVEMDTQWVGEERGVVTQRVWRGGDGRLMASCTQEGLVRLREGSVKPGERGEEGVVVRSKL